MFKTVYDLSSCKQRLTRSKYVDLHTISASNPQYPKFAHLLSPGWIPGRMVDNSDQQYAGFRDNVPYLFILMIVHPISRRLFETFFPLKSAAPDDRLNQRISFDVGSSLLFILALHGFSAFKVLLILYINFNIAMHMKREHVPVATWVFNIAILFANELGKGYPMGTIASMISPWPSSGDASSDGKLESNWGTELDTYGGLIPRWEVLFNVTVLRLISFNLDYCWSLDQVGGSPIEVCKYNIVRSPSCLDC